MDNSVQDFQIKIDGVLTSWAIKYNVSHDYHQQLVENIKPLLEVLFKKVKKGQRPSWLIQQDDSIPDSFTYALSSAETAYMTMARTQKNLKTIKKELFL